MTCEELYADILVMNASITVDNASIALANASLASHQMQKWYDQMNYSMQGCGTPPMARMDQPASEPESVAETRGRERLWEHLKATADQAVEDARTALGDAEKALDESRAARDALKAE